MAPGDGDFLSPLDDLRIDVARLRIRAERCSQELERIRARLVLLERTIDLQIGTADGESVE
jgi:hypothetical protein